MYNLTLLAEREVVEELRPILQRHGMSVSSFLRKAMDDFLESHKYRDRVININEVEALR